MFIQELKKLLESSVEQDREEEITVRNVLRNIEDDLPYECRYKEYNVFANKKTVEWVTQESSPHQSLLAAEEIADALKHAGLRGWTVKVVLRDLVRNHDADTPWAVAHTDSQVSANEDEFDDDYASNDSHHTNVEFMRLDDENDLDQYDESGRNTKHIRRYSSEVGPVTYVQASGDDMPILAVWYDYAGTGSAPLTGAFTSIDAYIAADPHSPSNHAMSEGVQRSRVTEGKDTIVKDSMMFIHRDDFAGRDVIKTDAAALDVKVKISRVNDKDLPGWDILASGSAMNVGKLFQKHGLKKGTSLKAAIAWAESNQAA